MGRKVVKSTSKGQITLPKQWRKLFQTDVFIVEMEQDKLTVKPLSIDDIAEEEILFDADKDNEGKGVSPDEMITLLEKL
jgi:bifunctional DNA-binding transcriptional regulator/antitoxin component of YhaV-PrlF toxin-antitoxin module